MYNTIFSSMPIGWFSSLDKAYEREELLSDPRLYIPGREKKFFNKCMFWGWIRDGFLHGIFILGVCLGTMTNTSTGPDGILEDLGFIEIGRAHV